MPLGRGLRRLVPRLRGPLRPWPSHRGQVLPGETSRHLGELYIRQFVDLADLTPDQAVLEPGCGTGRMAEPLTRYLTATGSYEGFDVMAEAVEWCQENIASSHPNFHFRHVDVLNRAYNPNGTLSPTEFEFPYEREAFDFVFLTSVFTHMLPPEVRRYMSEVRRVLRPSGRCLMTFFLLNEESIEATRSGRATRRFARRGNGYFYDVRKSPEEAVAYPEEALLEMLERAGLELHGSIRYGRWTGRTAPDGVGQDIVVVRPQRDGGKPQPAGGTQQAALR